VVAGELDELVLVTTTELASLHVTKRALPVLSRSGLPAEALSVVLNRTRKADVLAPGELQKILGIGIRWTVPNDYHTLQAAGEVALAGESALVVAIRRIAAGLMEGKAEKKGSGPEGAMALGWA